MQQTKLTLNQYQLCIQRHAHSKEHDLGLSEERPLGAQNLFGFEGI